MNTPGSITVRPSASHQFRPIDADSAMLVDTRAPLAAALELFAAGETDQAIAGLHAALANGSASPEGWNDLGNLLAHAGRCAEAADAFRRALGRSPRSALIWNNLGAVLERDAHATAAECAYRRAVALKARFHEAHQNLARVLDARGETIEAARHHCLAFVHGPREGKPPAMLGLAYYHLGQLDAAAQIYREWLAAEPDNPVAVHRLAACLREGMPTRVSDAYLEATFDAFAPSFDEHLHKLGFQGPQMIEQALRQVRAPDGSARVLDAGCGTGLCGRQVKPWAGLLHGVDLSAGMLARAYPLGIYDHLEKAEITRYLCDSRQIYDMVVASDTFNYFGELLPVFEAASGALAPDGLLVFTIEEGTGLCGARGWHLAVHGRYQHEPAAIEQWLAAAGFELLAVQTGVLRQELGEGVAALVYTARRRPDRAAV